MSARIFRVARSSRALAKASRLRELSCAFATADAFDFPRSALQKVRLGGTPRPTLGTSVLPGTRRTHLQPNEHL